MSYKKLEQSSKNIFTVASLYFVLKLKITKNHFTFEATLSPQPINILKIELPKNLSQTYQTIRKSQNSCPTKTLQDFSPLGISSFVEGAVSQNKFRLYLYVVNARPQQSSRVEIFLFKHKEQRLVHQLTIENPAFTRYFIFGVVLSLFSFPGETG